MSEPEAQRFEVHFSPGAGTWRHIVELLDAAEHTADICVFTITDDRIADAILAAHKRGVAVRVISDDIKYRDPGSDVGRLHRRGVRLVTDHTDAHMHHKFAVIDGRVVIAGSYNWTTAADRENYDDLMVLRDPGLVAAFAKRFAQLWQRLGPERT